MKIYKPKIKDLYLFILGFLGFSMLGQYVVLSVLHFPFSFMELYYLPLLYIYRKRLLCCIKSVFARPSKKMLLLEFLLLCGVLFGIVETMSFGMIIRYRTIIYMFLIVSYLKKYSVTVDLNLVYKVNLAAILGDFVYINVFSRSDISSSINCVAIALAILSAFLGEHYMWGCIATVIGVLNGVTSGFRLGIIIPFLVLFEALAYTLVRNDNRWNRSSFTKRFGVLVVAVILIILAITNYESVIAFVAKKMGMSYFAIYRVTERMKGLLSLDFAGSQDTGRLIFYQYPLQRFLRCIFPRGLIGEDIGEYWLYIDVPILYLYDLFGSLGAWTILIGCLYFTCTHIKYLFYKKADSKILLATLMMPILFFLEIINGTFAIVLFQGIETAIILGILFLSPVLQKNMNNNVGYTIKTQKEENLL